MQVCYYYAHVCYVYRNVFIMVIKLEKYYFYKLTINVTI